MTAPTRESLLQARVERLIDLLKERRIDALVIFEPKTAQWLTGRPQTQEAVWLDTSDGVVITDYSFRDFAAVRTLGVVGDIPASFLASLAARAGSIRDATAQVLEARRAKDLIEQALLRRAAEVTSSALRAADWETAEIQQTLANSVLREIWAAGGDGWAYDPSIACDAETKNVWSAPSPTPLATSRRMVMDAAASYRGYKADCTVTLERTRTRERAPLADVMIELTDAIARGVRGCSDIATMADRLLGAAGFDSLPHAIGHGVGLDLHEYPYLTRSSTHRLVPGDVFMIEPAYYNATQGGRFESMFAIDSDDQLVCLLDGHAIATEIERVWS